MKNKTNCAWCNPWKSGDPIVSHGVCQYHYIRGLEQAGIKPEPEEYEALWAELESRAVPFSVTHNIILPFFVAACVFCLLLAISAWACKGFEIVGR